MNKYFLSLSKITLVALLSSSIALAQPNDNIRLNQVGFYPFSPKEAAIVNTTASSFKIKSTDRTQIHHEGTLSNAATWTSSGESVQIANFTDFTKEGTFVLELNNGSYSYPFSIKADIHTSVNKALIKAFYFNRTSFALDPQYAGKWARPAGHPDTEVIVHPSAASTLRPAGTKLSIPGGWYDAGDYNSYIVNSGISTYTLLASYLQFKGYYDTLDLNIPESSNQIPDLLDEIKFNLDWMLKMQDPNDGGVYFKKTSASFGGFVMPAAENNVTRYVVTKSTSAALDFAAVMAVAYRAYASWNPTYAQQCLEAAIMAYDWAKANPAIYFKNPVAVNGYPAISTGEYGNDNVTDEFDWAANELYISTKQDGYYNGIRASNAYGVPAWPSVRTLGLLSLIQYRKELTAKAAVDTTAMKNILLGMANSFVNYREKNSPYRIVMGVGGNGEFFWGSNAQVGNQAMLLLSAYLVTSNPSYLSASLAQLDYLLGRNATGYSFISGFGSKPVMNLHHRPSGGDNNIDPVPGWVAGGPANEAGDLCFTDATYPAKSFEDHQDCYAKNEVAINWNAPAVFVTGALEALDILNKANPSGLINLNKRSVSPLVVFPAPSKGATTVTFHATHASPAFIHIVDELGNAKINLIKTTIVGENKIDLSLEGLTSGFYLINISSEKQNWNGKLIIN